jgi:hypothetical protein
MNEDRPNEEHEERPRPRVVDKRVSSRGAPAQTPRPEPREPAAEPAPAPGPEVAPTPAAAASPQPPERPAETPSDVWTPEQEAQARRIAEEIARAPAADLVVGFSMNFVEAASVKLEAGDLAGAQLVIDAFEALVKALGPRLGEAEASMRSVLAQLQMAFAQRAAAPPSPDQ